MSAVKLLDMHFRDPSGESLSGPANSKGGDIKMAKHDKRRDGKKDRRER